jgi:hypothetical protein
VETAEGGGLIPLSAKSQWVTKILVFCFVFVRRLLTRKNVREKTKNMQSRLPAKETYTHDYNVCKITNIFC